MKLSPLAKKLDDLCKDRGVSPRAASLQATGDPDTIRNIMRGKSLHPRIDTLQALANYFCVPVTFFSSAREQHPRERMLLPAKGLQVMGKIEKGVWIEADKIAPSGHLPILADPRWPASKQVAYAIGEHEYVTVLLTPEDYDASHTLVIKRLMTAHDIVELSLARPDGNGGFAYQEDGKAVPAMDGVETSVVGVVLWRLSYHGP